MTRDLLIIARDTVVCWLALGALAMALAAVW
jgi:hypothetical protein